VNALPPAPVSAHKFFLIFVSKTDLNYQPTNQKQFPTNPQLCKGLTENRRWYSGIISDTPVIGAARTLCSQRCTSRYRNRFCRARFPSCRTVPTSEYFFNSHRSAFL